MSEGLSTNNFLFVKQKTLQPPAFNGQYENGQNANQDQMKNTCFFYIVFQVLKVRLIKIWNIEP